MGEDGASHQCLEDMALMRAIPGMVGEVLALEMVDTFLKTPFSGEERHQRRIDKMEA